MSIGTFRKGSFFLVVMAISVSCAAQKNNSKNYYHEDLYTLRPKVEDIPDTAANPNFIKKKGDVVASRNVNGRVDPVLDSINRFNASRKYIDGYTILIYSGQNREEAMNTKKKMSTEAGMNGELEYNQPKFRVRAGNYFSRLEAQKDLLRLKRAFPNAILVPEKILVR